VENRNLFVYYFSLNVFDIKVVLNL